MGPRSETHRDDDFFDDISHAGQVPIYRTDIESKDGDVYSARGGTSEESQRGASDAYHKDCDDD